MSILRRQFTPDVSGSSPGCDDPRARPLGGPRRRVRVRQWAYVRRQRSPTGPACPPSPPTMPEPGAGQRRSSFRPIVDYGCSPTRLRGTGPPPARSTGSASRATTALDPRPPGGARGGSLGGSGPAAPSCPSGAISGTPAIERSFRNAAALSACATRSPSRTVSAPMSSATTPARAATVAGVPEEASSWTQPRSAGSTDSTGC